MNSPTVNTYHTPVLLEEVIAGLSVKPGGCYIDCTIGDGGHAAAILDASAPNGRLLGLDLDSAGIAVSKIRLTSYGAAAKVVHSNYDQLSSVAQANGFFPADGVLFDLGISSRQIDHENRGFSFQRQDHLDMRFDASNGLTAAEIVNDFDETELAEIIYKFGEEPRSRRIAKSIVANRPVQTASDLAEIVRKSAGYPRGRIHPATRVFQALRIAVNDELGNLYRGLEQAAVTLKRGGFLVTISYHSLEDRLIKYSFNGKYESLKSTFNPVNKKVIRPNREEVLQNRRSRSAKLRIAVRN